MLILSKVVIASEDVKLLIKQLGSEDIKERCQAQWQLLEYGKKAIPYLLKALNDKNSNVREGAVWLLGKIKSQEAVKPLIKILFKDKDFLVRSYAALSLGEIGDVQAVKPLIKALNSNSIEYVLVKPSAIKALGMLNDPSAIPVLIKCLENPSLREESIRSLCELKALVALPYLQKLQLNIEEAVTKEELNKTIFALNNWGMSQILNINKLTSEEQKAIKQQLYQLNINALPLLFQAYPKADKPTKLVILELIEEIKSPTCIDELNKLKSRERDPKLKEKIASLLDKLLYSVDYWLNQLLKEEDKDTQERAINNLISMPKESLPRLVQLLQKGNDKEKELASYILGEMKLSQARPPLIKALSSENQLVRLAIIEALVKLGYDQSLTYELVYNKDYKIRMGLCEVLVKLHNPSSTSALLKVLKQDKVTRVKESAASALGEIGSLNILPQLLSMLKEENSTETRIYAIRVIANLEAKQATKAIVDCLQDKDVMIRGEAVDALIKLEAKEAIPSLRKALTEENSYYVQEKITKALKLLNKNAQ